MKSRSTKEEKLGLMNWSLERPTCLEQAHDPNLLGRGRAEMREENTKDKDVEVGEAITNNKPGEDEDDVPLVRSQYCQGS